MSNIQLASTRLNEWHVASCDWRGHPITLSDCILTENPLHIFSELICHVIGYLILLNNITQI